MPIIMPNNVPVQMNVVTHEGKVIIQFDREVREIGLDVSSAAQVARAIALAAQDLASSARQAAEIKRFLS